MQDRHEMQEDSKTLHAKACTHGSDTLQPHNNAELSQKLIAPALHPYAHGFHTFMQPFATGLRCVLQVLNSSGKGCHCTQECIAGGAAGC